MRSHKPEHNDSPMLARSRMRAEVAEAANARLLAKLRKKSKEVAAMRFVTMMLIILMLLIVSRPADAQVTKPAAEKTGGAAVALAASSAGVA